MQTKGTLYWITGLAGAGKTTIGSTLYYTLKDIKDNIVILDGDILKKIVGGGYSYEERLERAMRYSSLCKALTDQGVSVICCTVAMFDSVREWNRKHIERYVEVFLDVSLDTLKERDKKGLYSGGAKGDIKNVVGIDVNVEFPKTPDIVIRNDGSASIEQCVKQIISYEVIAKDSFDRDAGYWNEYYNNHPVTMDNDESQFARDMLNYMEMGKDLIEFGCGNGRDSIFFAKNGLNVTGIDVSENAITMLQDCCKDTGMKFIYEDFSSASVIFQTVHDYCYSRFTLHAITASQEDFMIKNAYDTLKGNGGKLFIEARSIHDDIYGKGDCVGKNAYIYEGHYRRFIILEELIEKLKNIGFKILYSAENRDFAPYKEQNPVLIRVVAEKTGE